MRVRLDLLLLACVVSSLMPALAVGGCGGSLPERYVLERDVGDYSYRRYQKVLDVEFPIEGNAAVGHTASYVHRDRTRDVTFATAFVTVYEKPRGLTAEIRTRLNTLGTYDVTVGELEGEHVWWLDGGDDAWAMWVSGQYLVKLGAPRGEDIPSDVADDYTDLYPSDLDERGRAREGTSSYGPASLDDEEGDEELDIPQHLREDAPR
ncbi:MAG: hypothetical protein AAGF12_25685 [Myxococcota bacterium]